MGTGKIEEAAERYAVKHSFNDIGYAGSLNDFTKGALSDAAKEYWFERFKAEKQVLTDEEMLDLFEKELETDTTILEATAEKWFIKGFKSALQLTNK